MNKYEEFKAALLSAGFEESTYTTFCIFDGDESPEHTELGWKESEALFKEISKQFNYEVVDGEGGTEGGGEYCYGVICVGEEYYKAEWSYYSYSGCDTDYMEDTIKEVVPEEKTITVYVEKK